VYAVVKNQFNETKLLRRTAGSGSSSSSSTTDSA
jgi:hypothetical protein